MNLKYLWYRFLWKIAPYNPPEFPIHLDIELTSRCNLKCNMCPHGENKVNFPVGDMDWTMLKDILLQGREGKHKAYSVKFQWRGESTLYRQLPEAVNLAKSLGYLDIMLNTNGNYPMGLNSRLGNLTTCIFSIDSILDGIYKEIRKGGKLEVAVNNAINMKQLYPKMNVVVQVRIQKLNKNESHAIKEFFNSFGIQVKVGNVIKRSEGDYVLGGLKSVGRQNCWMPWRRLLIDWQGNIFPCCVDWYVKDPLGNIKSWTLEEIWHSPQIRTLRNALQSSIAFKGMPACKDCFSRESYIWEVKK